MQQHSLPSFSGYLGWKVSLEEAGWAGALSLSLSISLALSSSLFTSPAQKSIYYLSGCPFGQQMKLPVTRTSFGYWQSLVNISGARPDWTFRVLFMLFVRRTSRSSTRRVWRRCQTRSEASISAPELLWSPRVGVRASHLCCLPADRVLTMPSVVSASQGGIRALATGVAWVKRHRWHVQVHVQTAWEPDALCAPFNAHSPLVACTMPLHVGAMVPDNTIIWVARQHHHLSWVPANCARDRWRASAAVACTEQICSRQEQVLQPQAALLRGALQAYMQGSSYTTVWQA